MIAVLYLKQNYFEDKNIIDSIKSLLLFTDINSLGAWKSSSIISITNI